MNESDKPQMTSISKAQTIEEIAEFWDTHSLADTWDDTEAADVEFAPVLGRHMLVPVDPDLLLRVQRAAQKRGLSLESLVNLSLEQRMQQLLVTETAATWGFVLNTSLDACSLEHLTADSRIVLDVGSTAEAALKIRQMVYTGQE